MHTIASLFSGAGGLDTGFENAGFHVSYANEFDKKIVPTLRANFPDSNIDSRSLFDVPSEEIPYTLGVVGGPPCQSWSIGGAGRGFEDKRGQLFMEYIRVIKDKEPLFFLAENVKGILGIRHKDALAEIIAEFEALGYDLNYKLVNANDYGVPQDRWRVIFVGYHKSMGKTFEFPDELAHKPTLKDAIWDLDGLAIPAPKNGTNGLMKPYANNEYMTGGFSSMFMSRNRVRTWDQPSYTIQAGARQAPLHPSAPLMVKVSDNSHIFAIGKENMYRRLSVREAARVQTFPDDYKFVYDNVAYGYKMIGNAVPVKLGEAIANEIKKDVDKYLASNSSW